MNHIKTRWPFWSTLKGAYLSNCTEMLRNGKMIGWRAKPHQKKKKKKSLKFQTAVFVTAHIHTKAFFRRGPSWADSNYSRAVLKRREKQQQSSSGTFNHILECCSRCSKMEARGWEGAETSRTLPGQFRPWHCCCD